MHELPFLHSYGEQSMGDGVPSLTIGITRDGKTGMSGRKLAKLFRCNQLDLPKLIYENTGVFNAYKNGTFDGKSQSGRGVSMHTTHRIPLSHRAGGKELHLFPSELIATAANQRQLHLARQGIDHPPLTAFVEYCIARTLDTIIKEALGWLPTDRFLRAADEVKPYRPQFKDLYHAVKRKFGIKPTPGVWLNLEEIIRGMANAARTQRDVLGIRYNHMAFNDDGKDQLALDAEMAMLLVNTSSSFKEFLGNLVGWRSGMWQQKLDMQQGKARPA